MTNFANYNTRVWFFLCAILLLLYWQTLVYPFQFDDYNVIVNRQSVHGLAAWWQSMPGMRPLLKLSYAANWQMDAQPYFFRLFNVGCHIASSFLVFILVKNLLPFLTKSQTAKHQITSSQFTNIALFTAILFVLHPAHTEVVIYISSRSAGLMSLFCLASVTAYLRWLTEKTPTYQLWLATLCWFAAVFVKEVALILPALLIWLTYFIAPEKFSQLVQLGFKQKWIIFTILLIPLLWVLSIPQYARLFTNLSHLQLEHLVNQPAAHIHYLSKTLWGIGLNIDYSALIITKTHRITAGLALVVLVYLCWRKRKQWPVFSFALGWWLICLLPTNSIIYRPDLINDRQIYLASVGMLVLVSVLMARAFLYFPKYFNTVLVLVVLIYFGGSSLQRSADYQTEISLWQASLRQNRNNPRAWNNLGYAFHLAGDDIKAKDCYENALILNPKYQKASYNLQLINGLLKQ